MTFFDENSDGLIDPNTGEMVQEDHYYPFGLRLGGLSSTTGTPNRWKYNGKELHDELGLNWYDYGARMYEPSVGRWNGVDALGEKMPSWSGYVYTYNSPIVFIDLMGLIPWPVPEKWMKKATTIYRRISSKYGPRTRDGKTRIHHGLDMNLGAGDDDLGVPVYATHDGVVLRNRDKSDKDGAGNRIHIQSADKKFKTVYMHLKDAPNLKEGDQVKEGDIIGYIGGSGFGKDFGQAVHLHYEIHKRNENGEFESINPLDEEGNLIDPQSWIEANRDNLPQGQRFDIEDEKGNIIGYGISYDQEEIQQFLEKESDRSLLEALLKLLRGY